MKSMLLLAAIAMTALCGCANINNHFGECGSRVEINYPYRDTVGNLSIWSEVFGARPEKHGGSAGEAGIAHAYAVLLFPLIVVDLPLEIVADTITMPYDAYVAITAPKLCEACSPRVFEKYGDKYECRGCHSGQCIGGGRCLCRCKAGECAGSAK